MNKIKVSFITLAVSILCIVVFQLYWITKSYTIKEEQFSGAVNDALIKSVKKLQSYKVISILCDNLKSDTDTFEINNCDTIITKVDSFSTNNVITKDCMKVMIKTTKNCISDDSLKSIVSNITLSSNPLSKKSSKTIFVNKVLNQVVTEYESSENSLSTYDKTRLDTVLKTELLDKGIVLPFEYSIITEKDTLIKNLTSTGFAIDMISDAYKTRVFPDNLLIPSDYLLVVFPGKNNYLLSSLWITMFLSLLFSLIIIITYIYTVRVFFRQKKLNDIKSDFVNNMTHELKTPIATISLSADSLMNEKVIDNPEKIRFFAKAIKQENARMNQHVEQVLQLSLIENNAFSLDLRNYDINLLVSSIIERVRLIVEQKGGSINLYSDPNLPQTEIDMTHFSNVISNLIDNACKYSDQEPKIQIELTFDDKNIIMRVVDNGIGIPDIYKQKIFEKFYRVPTGNIHDVKGFGLGLSYVNAVVQAHHGTVHVENNAGKGSTFILTIPLKSN
ncbi:MAG: hypothetical protein CVU05_02780 [Bacteroidetes bacterium HGW-Bacteroidetes-21]|nr:MAG: hypothetical protein CVU05_02780 [Bacteroidetes bacterium HGW-Bacteroidetes-21]